MSKDLKILIVEDEGIIAEHLKVILMAQGFEKIETANNKERALIMIEIFKPDLLLLDIRMRQSLDGIEIAEFLNNNYQVPFIFITAHSDPLILKQALDTKPAGYITKPFNQANVYAAIQIAMSNIQPKEDDSITLKDGFDVIKLEFQSILYIESDRNYIDIYTEKGKMSIRHSLEWFIGNVSENQFMRIHRSFVVNLSKIERISSSNAIIGEHDIPISRKYINELREKLSNI